MDQAGGSFDLDVDLEAEAAAMGSPRDLEHRLGDEVVAPGFSPVSSPGSLSGSSGPSPHQEPAVAADEPSEAAPPPSVSKLGDLKSFFEVNCVIRSDVA